MIRLFKRKTRDTPHVPFYKDERIIGKRVTVQVYLRLLLIAVIIFALTTGWAFFSLFDYLGKAHANRVKDQMQTDQKIQSLVCFTIRHAPDSVSDVVKGLREQYHCPPPTPDSTTPTPTPSKTPGKTSSTARSIGAPPGQSTPPNGQPTPTPHSTPHSTPRNTPTSTHVPTHPRTTPKPTPSKSTTPPVIGLPGPGKTCQLSVAGICVLG